MSNPFIPVPLSALVTDCTDMASFLVDLPPGGRRGMVCEQDGFSDVIAEIEANQDQLGEIAGITKTDFESFQASNQRVAMIDARLPMLKKLVEILEETRAKEDDKRQRQANGFAESVDRRAKTIGDASLLAKYEKTRTYRSAIAMKGVKTRTKKAKSAQPAPDASPEA